MFFKIASVKALMAAAYKGEGLTIGRDEYSETRKVGFFISGHGWTIWNNENCICNKLKAAIVEYCGTLPEYGEQILVSKNSSGQQVSMLDPAMYLPGTTKDMSGIWDITPLHVIRDKDFIILQHKGAGTETREIPARYVNAIAPKEIEEDRGETYPNGPYKAGSAAVWMNNVCYFKTDTYVSDADEMLMVHLNRISINPEA